MARPVLLAMRAFSAWDMLGQGGAVCRGAPGPGMQEVVTLDFVQLLCVRLSP